jgi:hypothetical protein
MKAFKFSTRYVNALHVLERFLDKEQLDAEQIRTYDDQGRVIEFINNKLLVPVERMKVQRGEEYVHVWYLTDKTIGDFHNAREQQYKQQLSAVTAARQHRKAVTAVSLLESLGESVPHSIRTLLAANDNN